MTPTNPTFLSAVHYIVDSEGEYSNNPHDKGGPTMYGISWNAHSAWLLKNGVTLATLPQMPLATAYKFYYEEMWVPSDAEGITDPELAYLHLDSAVQHGVAQALIFLHALPQNPKSFDFSGGKNSALAAKLFGIYFMNRLKYYASLKDFQYFGRGWLNRCADVIHNAIMSEGT